MSRPLHSLQIINTRPVHQAGHLNQQLQALGATPVSFPCLDIHFFDANQLRPPLHAIDQLDYAVFLSANAVHALMPLWPPHLTPQYIAIGSATARALSQYTHQHCLHPSHFNTNSLLELPALKMKDKITLIASGSLHHALINDTLNNRQHKVISIPCYESRCPIISDISPLRHCKTPRIVLSTSQQSLKNLLLLTRQHHMDIKTYPLLIISPEMKAFLSQQHWQAPILLSQNATDSSIIDTLLTQASQLF